MLWAAKPSIPDRIQLYTILSCFVFMWPGVVGLAHVDEISQTSRAIGKVIYGLWFLAYSVTLAVNIRSKKLIAQNRRFAKGSHIGEIPIIQGIRGNLAWLFLPLGIALCGAMGYISILYGPVYLVECIVTDLSCEYMRPDLRYY